MNIIRQSRPDIYEQVAKARSDGRANYAAHGLATGQKQYQSADTNKVLKKNVQKLQSNPQAVEKLITDCASDKELEAVKKNIEDYLAGVGEDSATFTPQEKERRQRMWQQWNNRSQNSGRLGLDLTDAQNNTRSANESPIIPGSSSELKSAKEYRAATSQDDLLKRQ
jgi:hypothetical protein